MKHITKTLERGQIVMRCVCGKIGSVSAKLDKRTRERSVEWFEKDHKKCAGNK